MNFADSVGRRTGRRLSANEALGLVDLAWLSIRTARRNLEALTLTDQTLTAGVPYVDLTVFEVGTRQRPVQIVQARNRNVTIGTRPRLTTIGGRSREVDFATATARRPEGDPQ